MRLDDVNQVFEGILDYVSTLQSSISFLQPIPINKMVKNNYLVILMRSIILCVPATY